MILLLWLRWRLLLLPINDARERSSTSPRTGSSSVVRKKYIYCPRFATVTPATTSLPLLPTIRPPTCILSPGPLLPSLPTLSHQGPPCTRPTHPVLPRSRPVPPALSCPASTRPVSSTHTGNLKSSLCEVAEGKLMLNGRVRVRLQVEPRGGAQEPAPGSDLAQPSRGAHGRPAPPSPVPPHPTTPL
ncbi:hypothetical protein Pmani_003848 [Petrolisthes manimaculis]|uniref:Uncharacterized protein n=1 Tax=Petrolisthes manimaculis TaxID=1843537 RepID=A0AAE1UJ26_9EUCA|nr:hypothetical protein Pmani_003848 [Petrolisthes manimaculis]